MPERGLRVVVACSLPKETKRAPDQHFRPPLRAKLKLHISRGTNFPLRTHLMQSGLSDDECEERERVSM